MYQDGYFCSRCEQKLFGHYALGYTSFIRSERMRLIHRRRKWPSFGASPGGSSGSSGS